MEEGFLLDVSYGTAVPTRWVSEPPVRSFWTGVRLRGRRQFEVESFRCSSCGFLDSYALKEVTGRRR